MTALFVYAALSGWALAAFLALKNAGLKYELENVRLLVGAAAKRLGETWPNTGDAE